MFTDITLVCFLHLEASFRPGEFYHPIFAWGESSLIEGDKIILKGNMNFDKSSMDEHCPYSTDFIWVRTENTADNNQNCG